jgi:hypothetical protein
MLCIVAGCLKSLTRESYPFLYLLNNLFYSAKELWSSAEIINFINYFCCNLFCITLLLCYAQCLILETVVLIFVYCIVLSSFVLFVCSVFPDKFHIRLLYNRIMDLQNDICMYV